MKYLAILLAVFALVLTGCSGEDKAPSDTGTTVKDAGKTAGDAMKGAGDAAKDAAGETLTFECADPSCTTTKEGTMAEPPS